MNCYYSNLIEGHDTHPIDIERALQGDYSNDAKKRDLQLEAKAHIAVQQWIDEGGLRGRAVTADAIREIHRRFCESLPEDLLWVEDPATHERMQVIPGELRTATSTVGDHIAISPAAVPALPRSGSKRSTAVSARRKPSSPRRRPITASRGFTRSSTATAASRG